MQNARKRHVRQMGREDRRAGDTVRGHSPAYAAVSGTARGDFPSRPAAHLAGLTDRVRRLADRTLPRTTAERALDLVLGTVLLAVTCPAVAVAALVLTARRTPGGAWDRRPRAGLGGRVFELRTLRTRRLRLDLFSRLPHVVRGDLALVGPAPWPPAIPGPPAPAPGSGGGNCDRD